MSRHSDGRPEPLAVELLAFAARVLHCDVAGCGQVAAWRSNNENSAKTIYRCEEHRIAATSISGIGLPPGNQGRHRDDPPLSK